MTSSEHVVKFAAVDQAANPAPLGLFAFALTTAFLGFSHLQLGNFSSTLIGAALFIGGFAQIIGGVLCFFKRATFGLVAFTMYGAFWVAVGAAKVLQTRYPVLIPDSTSSGVFDIIFGVFTTFMGFCTVTMSLQMVATFAPLAPAFFVLAAAKFSGNDTVEFVGGILALLSAAAAAWGAIADVYEEVFKRSIVPVGALSVDRPLFKCLRPPSVVEPTIVSACSPASQPVSPRLGVPTPNGHGIEMPNLVKSSGTAATSVHQLTATP
eukprot:TRINITY_DN34274_c0_g1_i1.p1 TRINITY_DN34274_c0_g1~~TRINITY_DN34274_c0_g1_i1.p1  ORF type:complete len:266 (+),score=53.00 TRINITY_DN34274_c0_g1_i1:97-894(+)